MSQYSKILVGVDLHHGDRMVSEEFPLETRTAINQALDLATHSSGVVTFCAVLEISAQAASLIEKDHANLLRTVEDFANERLDAEVAAAKTRGVHAEKVVRIGTAWEELVKQACEKHHDLIVIATRRPQIAKRHLFGGTAQKLIRNAPCPVWVVKPDEVREIREIAAATDLSDSSIPVLHAAVGTARALNARLFVLHVLEQVPMSHLLIAGVSEEEIGRLVEGMREDATAKVQSHLSQTDYRTLQHGVKVEIVTGSPDHVIGDFVADNGVDLVILGTHGRRGLEGFLLGNTAERILPSINASVLAVKPDGFVSPYAGK